MEKNQSGDLKQLKDQFQCSDFALNPAFNREMLAADFLILFDSSFFNLWSHINYQGSAICSNDVLSI